MVPGGSRESNYIVRAGLGGLCDFVCTLDLLQGFLPAKERNGNYRAGWIRRCAPRADLADLSDLSRQTPATLHKVIESLKIRLESEKIKMADVPF